MAKTYLDETGLAALWGKIKTYVTNAIKVTGVKGNAETSYRTGNVNLTANNIGAINKNTRGNTTELYQTAIRGVSDVTVRPMINQARANHLAFLPADQIIVEKTTNGGTTWVDAGLSDSEKRQIFAETRAYYMPLPQINGKKNLLCGLRITITGMKYNVPSGTAETAKYNYWNSNYALSTERYFQLNTMYFWISSSNDTMSIKVERATGGNSTNWVTAFSDNDYYMNGWSGADFVALQSPAVFGGYTNQTGNWWNWRFTFMTRGKDGSTTTMNTGSETQFQTIAEIRGYGDTVWAMPNTYMGFDKMYSHDFDQNVTFPAKVTASGGFVGALTGTATKATQDSSGNNIVNTYLTKAAGVTNVAYDSTNTKFTKTINGTTSDIVTLSTLKTAMSLNNVANGAEVNQNAFSNVKVGSTTVAADSKTDTIELAAGSNITLTPDTTNDKVTIAAKDTVTTVTTTGSGNAVTGITASNGALTVTKGSTFLTQHQNAISGVNSNYTEDGTLYGETVDAPLPQSSLDLASHNNIIATSLSAGSTGSVNVYLDLAVYGTCSTAAATAAKTVTGIKGFALSTGSIVAVKFTNANTAAESTLTLNVNGTGAKPIKYRGGTIPANKNHLSAGRLYWFVYDGTNYEIIGDLEFTYPVMTQAEATQGTLTTARAITPAVLKTTIANAVGEAGGGDMTKAIYDTNNDGKVDNANNSTQWNGIYTDFGADYTDVGVDLMVAAYIYADYQNYHKPTYMRSLSASYTPANGAIARYDSNGILHSTSPNITTNDTTVATTAFVNTFVSTAIDDTKEKIIDITNQFSSSNSRIKITSAYKVGKTVTVRFDVTRASAIANGADIQAQITSQYLPLLTETSTRMWGSGFLIATFVGKDGVVNQTSDTHDQGYLWFRNSSGSSISKSSTITLPITITYIYDDGTIS